jgi:hypothetical protein
VVDATGTVSFVVPAHVVKMLAAACSHGPVDHRQLLDRARRYDPAAITVVTNGLAVFDEHNTGEHFSTIHGRLAEDAPAGPPFRVVDAVTREASLAPVDAGLVVFNLPARRIVQVQNSYAELQRRDRGRIRAEGEPTGRLFHYQLPAEWSILP